MPQEGFPEEEQEGMEMSSDISKSSKKTDLSAVEEARQLQEQAKPGFFESLKVFRDPQFLALTMAELAASIGYLIPLYYMQSKPKIVDDMHVQEDMEVYCNIDNY